MRNDLRRRLVRVDIRPALPSPSLCKSVQSDYPLRFSGMRTTPKPKMRGFLTPKTALALSQPRTSQV
jgi:hypothetical protein